MNRKQLLAAIAAIMEIEPDALNEADLLLQHGSWNSIAFLSVIAFYDETFNYIPEGNKLEQINTVADLMGLVEHRLTD